MSSPLLVVENLRTYFKLRSVDLRAVDGVSFGISAGRTLGVIGESGSGKSVLARSIIGLLSSSVQTDVSGVVKFDGRNLLKLSESEMRTVRGRDIAMIFQDPMTSLNPVMSIGRQIVQGVDVSVRILRPQQPVPWLPFASTSRSRLCLLTVSTSPLPFTWNCGHSAWMTLFIVENRCAGVSPADGSVFGAIVGRFGSTESFRLS